jgi:hypothetical protein
MRGRVVREREGERAGASAGQAAVGPNARAGAGARERAAWLGRTAGKKEKPARVRFCFSFSNK